MTRRSVLIFVCSLALSCTALQAAEAGAPAGTPDDQVPVINLRNGRAGSPDLCPVCGRTRTECNELGEQYRTLVRQGRAAEAKKLDVCPVHTSLGKIKSRPGLCPVCGHKVDIPLEGYQATGLDTDADLCPHPAGGQVQFYARIPLCPNCGFAAFTQHFEKPQPTQIKAWVRNALTPNLRRSQRQLLAMKLNQMDISDREVAALFNQETLPDVVRCEHALGLYTHIDAHPTWRIKLAMQCAWAYRREVCGPLHGPFQMESIRAIMKALEQAHGAHKDLQERIVVLAGFYRDTERFNYLDRQIIRFLLASYYDRLGLTAWSRTTLERILRAASHRYAEGEDPWLEGTEGPMSGRTEEAKRRKAVIAALADTRLRQLDRELEYLALAADLIREAFSEGIWAQTPRKIPTHVYLVGEFERRLQHFTRAREWLRASKHLLAADSSGAELYAPRQLRLMGDYMQRLGIQRFEPDEQAQADVALLRSLVHRVHTAQSDPPSRAASPPPMTLQGEAGSQTDPPHRNEVRFPEQEQ